MRKLLVLTALTTIILPSAAAMATNNGDTATTNTITLEVDYDADFDELVEKCGFDWREKKVTAANFPTEGAGKVELEFKMFRFTKHLSADEAVAEMDRLGFRPAQAVEFLTFIAQDKTVGQKKPAVCLGGVWKNGNDINNGQVICTQKITSPKSGWGVRAIYRSSRLFAGWPLLAVRNKTLE